MYQMIPECYSKIFKIQKKAFGPIPNYQILPFQYRAQLGYGAVDDDMMRNRFPSFVV
jgi:hypothetical protein